MAADENVDGWVKGNAPRDTTEDNLRAGRIWPYTGTAKLYRCPADRSHVLGRPGLPRFRSFALEGSFNLLGVEGSGIGLPAGSEPGGNLRRLTDAYQPSGQFGFLDVSETSINAGAFGIASTDAWLHPPFFWIHLPAERHRRGSNPSFLDGHAAHLSWKYTPRKHVRARQEPRPGADDEDLLWLKDRTQQGQHRLHTLVLRTP